MRPRAELGRVWHAKRAVFSPSNQIHLEHRAGQYRIRLILVKTCLSFFFIR